SVTAAVRRCPARSRRGPNPIDAFFSMRLIACTGTGRGRPPHMPSAKRLIASEKRRKPSGTLNGLDEGVEAMPPSNAFSTALRAMGFAVEQCFDGHDPLGRPSGLPLRPALNGRPRRHASAML